MVRVTSLTAAMPLGLIAATAGITLMSSYYVGQWFRVATAIRTTVQIGLIALVVAAAIALVTDITIVLVQHAAQAAAGAIACTFLIVRWQVGRDRERVARVSQAIALREANLDRVFEPVLAIRRPLVFDLVPQLFMIRRHDLLERLGREIRVPHYESFSALVLAKAQVELGKFDDAHAIAVQHEINYGKHGPESREGWRQLLARIQIGRGEAAAVIEMPMTCPIESPGLQGSWLLILADAYLVCGKRERATALMNDAFAIAASAPGVDIDQLLGLVAAQQRPISELAAAKRERPTG